ncbi:MAG: tetraacyldisaccharide 4'-kinase [Gammaproteobacteria bacterium]
MQQGWQQPGWLNRLVLPLAWLYGVLLRLRRQCYRSGLLQQQKMPVPVIVVGNLSVGGTGKTPLVIAIVEFLKQRGWKPGIVARGYRGRSSYWPRALEASDRSEQVGDEPLMVFRRTGGPVIVGPDRVANARMLIEKLDCNVVVSDDGFQHLNIARDIDIVVIDGDRRFGNGWCLPAGPLREFKSCLKWANITVVNSGSGQEQGEHEMTIETSPISLRCARDNASVR